MNESDRLTFRSSPRKIYRYSVIPGGVQSAAELAAARRADPIVARHYADFGGNASVVQARTDMYLYVSYRKADKVYWTVKKHKVCQGETLVSDGKNMARTRCGNRLSTTLKFPNFPGPEPTENALNDIVPPALPLDGLPQGPLLADFLPRAAAGFPGASTGASPALGPSAAHTGASVGASDFGPILPGILPLAGGGGVLGSPGNSTGTSSTGGKTPSGGGTPAGGGTTPSGTVNATPEPASALLVCLSLALAATLFFRKRGQRTRAAWLPGVSKSS